MNFLKKLTSKNLTLTKTYYRLLSNNKKKSIIINTKKNLIMINISFVKKRVNFFK